MDGIIKEKGGINLMAKIKKDYNEKLEILREKYCLPKSKQQKMMLIKEYLDLKTRNSDRIVVWGTGLHTEYLLSYFTFIHDKLAFMVDKNAEVIGKTLYEKPILDVQEIINQGIQTVLISSYSFRKTIRKELENMDGNINIIDIYEVDTGTRWNTPFYQDNIYITIHEKRQKYHHMNTTQNKEDILEEIILNYLEIRDLKNTLYYIDEYINKYTEKMNQYEQLKKGILELLEELKESLQERKQKDIFFVLYDALGARRVYDNPNMPYLNKLKDEGTYFTNAYSPSIFTLESIKAMFTGKTLRELKPNCTHFMPEEQIRLVDITKEFKYDFRVYSTGYGYKEEWNNEQKSSQIASVLWGAICNLVNTEAKNVCFIHTEETHHPFMCGRHEVERIFLDTDGWPLEEREKLFKQQYVETLKYIDSQTEFYLDLLNDDVVKIFFADHGWLVEESLEPSTTQVGYKPRQYTEKYLAGTRDEFNIPVIISGKGINKYKYEENFSTVDLWKILKHILKEDTSIIPDKRDVVEIEFEGFYNETRRHVELTKGAVDRVDGFRVLLYKEYKIFISRNGTIKICLKDKEDTFIRDEQKIKTILKEVQDYLHFE